MKYIILIFLSQYVAADEWYCTEDAAKRDGNVISTCGIGESMSDEGYARKRALNNAIEEFNTICDLSSDCAGRKINVEPKRTSCSKDSRGMIKCYRMIEVTVK